VQLAPRTSVRDDVKKKADGNYWSWPK